ncbi:hypothetical protein LP421_29425 [Rhizobium sp. RCAM05350]|nr:hypothetical protein LP421_29425 [Rhizobium sp. RCAM05350]
MLITGCHGARGDAASGRGRGRLRAYATLRARRRFLIEEGNIVKTIAHAAQCSDSEPKGQNSVLLLFQNVQLPCGDNRFLAAIKVDDQH